MREAEASTPPPANPPDFSPLPRGGRLPTFSETHHPKKSLHRFTDFLPEAHGKFQHPGWPGVFTCAGRIVRQQLVGIPFTPVAMGAGGELVGFFKDRGFELHQIETGGRVAGGAPVVRHSGLLSPRGERATFPKATE